MTSTWKTRTPDEIFEDLRSVVDHIDDFDAYVPMTMAFSPRAYAIVLKKWKRYCQRQDRKARRRHRKIRGW